MLNVDVISTACEIVKLRKIIVLFGLIGRHKFSSTMYIFMFLCFKLMEVCAAQAQPPPVINISETSLTARVNGSLELRCYIDKSTLSSPSGFEWRHTGVNGTEQLYEVSSSVPRVTIEELPSFPTSSTLRIANLSTADSGKINCRYFYPRGQGSTSVSYDAHVCVSEIPATPPTCFNDFTNYTVILRCIAGNICPTDVMLEWRSVTTSNLKIGNLQRNDTHAEYRLALQSKDLIAGEEFICKLKSTLYQEVSLNCTISAYETPTTVLPRTTTSTTRAATTIPEVSTIWQTTFEQFPETSSQTQTIIIVACAVGGGIFLLVSCCILILCCRKRNRNKDKPQNETDMWNKRSPNMHQYTNVPLSKETTQQENGPKDSLPSNASPDKNEMGHEPPVYQMVHDENFGSPVYQTVQGENLGSYDVITESGDKPSYDIAYESTDPPHDPRQDMYAKVARSPSEDKKFADDLNGGPQASSPHEYAYAQFESDGKDRGHGQTEMVGMVGRGDIKSTSAEGFVDCTVYEPS